VKKDRTKSKQQNKKA